MTDYKKLVEALRHCVSDEKGVTKCAGCPYYPDITGCMDRLHTDAADAIEALNRLVDLNTERCEGLRKQLREAHESYERHLKELEAQLPKRGEWVVSLTDEDEYPHMNCSQCGFYWKEVNHKRVFKNCPNCGAKMEVQE